MQHALLIVALLGLAACNWITDADVAGRQGDIDDDGDGVVASRDCDDGDPSISPALPEIWYDGIDQDCAGGDDYDQDGDGYVADEHVGLTTRGVANSGMLPGGDCDDTDPRVSPQQPDAPYDGIDRKCDGGDDYDQDGDGYVPDEYVGLPTRYVDGSGALPGGDCDDENDSVNPGIVDEPYDGYDADCSGNDDYDQDGDGFVRDEDFGKKTTYLEPSGNLPGGDCDDEDAAFNPGVAETWYDGLDENCAGGDDYDQDGDGYVPDGYGGLATAGVAGSGGLPSGDCNDTDDTVKPRAPETPGDGVDQDCDGGDDSVKAWAMPYYTWLSPQSPILVEAASRVYLSVATQQVITPGGTTWYDAGFAAYWDVGFVYNDPEWTGELAWSATSTNPTYESGTAHDFILDGTTLYGALGFKASNSRTLRLVSYPLGSGTAGSVTAQSSEPDDGFDDVSVAVDGSGVVHATGCDGGNNGVLTYVRVDALEGSAGWDVLSNVTDGSASAPACVMDLEGGPRIVAAHDGAVWGFAFDPSLDDPSFTGSVISTDYDPDDIDILPDADLPFQIADDSQRAVLTDLVDDELSIGTGPGDAASNVAAHQLDDGSWIVGWITATGTARVAWGSEAGGFTASDVSVDGTPTAIAVWSDGREGIVAVTTENDVGVGIYAW